MIGYARYVASLKFWQVEHSDVEPATLVCEAERVYSCDILTGIRRQCQASADNLLGLI